jgi:hypothetical protein
VTEETLRSRLEVYLQLRQSLGYQTPVHQQALRDFVNYLAAHNQPRTVQKLDLLQAQQLAAPVTAVFAAILCQCAGPSTRFACC